MDAFLALAVLLHQDPEAIVQQLEAKAASVRGLRFHARGAVDALGGDEIVERTSATGFAEVTPDGSLWEEAWAILIGPERKSTTTSSTRILTTRKEGLQYFRSVGGFEPGMENRRLLVRPIGGTWADHPGLDPWMSRHHTTSESAVDPLLLHALLPSLLRTEAELKISEQTDAAWVLDSRRTTDHGSITKRFTIRKKDHALARVLIERRSSWGVSGFEFEAKDFAPVKDLVIPTAVDARYLNYAYLARWRYRWEAEAPKAAERSRRDFPEVRFVSPLTRTRRDLEFRQMLQPDDPQLLADLGWGQFSRERWSHYDGVRQQDNRSMLRKLRELRPGNPAAREEWLYRTWRPGEVDEEFMTKDASEPLYNLGAMRLAAGPIDEADQISREGLAAARSPGDRLIWTCLRCGVLQRQGKKAESTSLWLALAAALDDGVPSTQVFLAEVAVGRGLVERFDPAVLSKKTGDLASALALLAVGSGPDLAAALRTCMAVPVARPLASELIVRRRVSDAALGKELAAISDVDAILTAASLGQTPDDLCDAAIALWEKEAYCRLWTWDVWGRTTLRMLRHLRALDQRDRALTLACRFVERCAEGKVSMWLGYYRWGELVGACLDPLRERDLPRYVDLLARSPELSWRLAFNFGREREFDLPMKEMLEHLKKSRDPAEARGWLRMAESKDLKGETLRPLVALAREVAPGDLLVENMYADVVGEEIPIEQRAELLRRTIAATKAGTFRDRTGGNYGMLYEKLARTYLDAKKLEEAAEATREMIREYPDMDSMTVINLALAIGTGGRRDLERQLYVVAARHNAHLRPFSARTVIERLEPLGEHAEIYALTLRTLGSWKNPPGRGDESDRRMIDEIQKARGRAAAHVKWEEVLKPWLDRARPEIPAWIGTVVKQAVDDLQADEAEKRAQAGRILVQAGDGAVPLLRAPALEGGPEERSHARSILERIYAAEWGN